MTILGQGPAGRALPAIPVHPCVESLTRLETIGGRCVLADPLEQLGIGFSGQLGPLASECHDEAFDLFGREIRQNGNVLMGRVKDLVQGIVSSKAACPTHCI